MERGNARRKILKIVIPVAAVLAAAVLAFVMLGIYAAECTAVFPNVSVSGVSVGEMTREEAEKALSADGVSFVKDMTVTVILTDNISVKATGKDAGFAVTPASAADLAMSYGHRDGFFVNTVKFIKSLSGKVDLSPYVTDNYDEEGIRARIDAAAAQAERPEMKAFYWINEDDILITKGAGGYTVPKEAVYEFIHSAFTADKKEDVTTDRFSMSKMSPPESGSLDIQAIYDKVFVEPKNAEYDKEKNMPSKSVTGVSFDLDAAKKAYDNADPGDKIKVDLIFTEPEITTEDIEALLFRDCLASKNTSLGSSSGNRLTNVTLAAAAVNGVVLNPGEEFSFNGLLGERTSAKGYKPAGAYVGGESVDQIGGGICQVSSTIYYCALKCDLEITERTEHMFTVSYVPLAMDATVNWGTLDFRFKNNRDYPIRIDAEVVNYELKVSIWGTKLDDDYIELDYKLIKTIPYQTVEKEDAKIPEGKTEVKTSGHPGYVADCYKYYYDKDGKLLKTECVGRSSYSKQDRVILIPIKKEPVVPVGPTEPPQPPTEPIPEDPGPVTPPPETPENTAAPETAA